MSPTLCLPPLQVMTPPTHTHTHVCTLMSLAQCPSPLKVLPPMQLHPLTETVMLQPEPDASGPPAASLVPPANAATAAADSSWSHLTMEDGEPVFRRSTGSGSGSIWSHMMAGSGTMSPLPGAVGSGSLGIGAAGGGSMHAPDVAVTQAEAQVGGQPGWAARWVGRQGLEGGGDDQPAICIN